MKRFGIHFRLLLSAILLICCTTFAMGFLGVSIIHRFVQSRFEERIQFLTKYLALNAELGILIDHGPMLEELARNLLSEKDIAGVMILNGEGEVLARVKRDIGRSLSTIEAPVLVKQSHEDNMAFQWGGGKQQQREFIGNVRVTYTTREIEGLLGTLKRRFVWVSLGLTVACLIFFYFISRSLVSPILKLAQAARQVAAGNTHIRVEPSRIPETRELALSFNAMLDSLESNRRALEEAHREMLRKNTLAEIGKFSMMIAHEVKNPLGIIKSSFDILKKGISDSPNHHTLTGYIEDEIGRLNQLIEAFLQFARPARPSFQQVDANELVRECVTRFELQALDHRTAVEKEISASPCPIRLDADLMTRCLHNLLKNASEASEEGGRIIVSARRENGYWRMAVQDEGKGIDPDHREKVFDPFFTTRAKGTGLGLAFVSQVVRAHSGTVAAENTEPSGARFTILLPVVPDAGGSDTGVRLES